MRLGALTLDTASLRDVVGIIVDTLRGSLCPHCVKRYRDMGRHLTVEHAGD